ncbi:molecular chaperone [Enterobacteriaceae bacterium C23F]
MKKIKFLCGLLCLAFSVSVFSEGLTLGATRLIYDAGKKEASVSLSSAGNGGPWLIQSWVSDIDKKTQDAAFVTTPPLYKLGANEDSLVRVVYVGKGQQLPEDRESVFLLNVRAVPAVKKEDAPKRLIVATQNIIKLIYRPTRLNTKDAQNAVSKIDAAYSNGKLIFKNPTPYVVTLTNLVIDGKKAERPGFILPFNSKNVALNKKPAQISFSAINDYGGLTDSKTFNF